jgi:ribosomal protein L11 methyltransferase
LIRLALRCAAASAEPILAELLELAPGGVEEVPEPDGRPGIVEYAIYGAEGELPDLGALRASAGGAIVEIRSEPVPSDWDERWKRFYHPVLIAGRLYVRPPWEPRAERGGVSEVVIDPGRAFGTGTHATTRMCLELLVAEAPPAGVTGPFARAAARLVGRRPTSPRSLCDLGSGSGVLAIAAAKLGFEPVLAVDADQAAVEETDRNARANYVELETRRLDLRREPPPLADLACANLTTRLIETVAATWADSGRAPATVIASGFLASEGGRIERAFERVGLLAARRMTDGEWGALLAQRRD